MTEYEFLMLMTIQVGGMMWAESQLLEESDADYPQNLRQAIVYGLKTLFWPVTLIRVLGWGIV